MEKRNSEFATYKLRFHDTMADDVRAHEILQTHYRKKDFIIKAIIAYENILSGYTPGPKDTPRRLTEAPDAVIEKLDSIERLVEKLLNEGIRHTPASEEPEKRWNPVESENQGGLNEDDMANFQLAAEAFGAFRDDDV